MARYVTTVRTQLTAEEAFAYDPQNFSSVGEGGELVVVGKSRLFTSTDRVTARSDGDSTLVTYDALLELNGLLRLGDPLLGLAFGRIGDRAAAGLRRVLAGQDVPS